MNSSDYRAELAALGLTQVGAVVLGISERTSRRYAAKGVPEKHSAWLREQINKFKQSQANKADGKEEE